MQEASLSLPHGILRRAAVARDADALVMRSGDVMAAEVVSRWWPYRLLLKCDRAVGVDETDGPDRQHQTYQRHTDADRERLRQHIHCHPNKLEHRSPRRPHVFDKQKLLEQHDALSQNCYGLENTNVINNNNNNDDIN